MIELNAYQLNVKNHFDQILKEKKVNFECDLESICVDYTIHFGSLDGRIQLEFPLEENKEEFYFQTWLIRPDDFTYKFINERHYSEKNLDNVIEYLSQLIDEARMFIRLASKIDMHLDSIRNLIEEYNLSDIITFDTTSEDIM